jgi:hypothetical protein
MQHAFVPAIWLSHLGVDASRRGHGLGSLLLLDALHVAARAAPVVAARSSFLLPRMNAPPSSLPVLASFPSRQTNIGVTWLCRTFWRPSTNLTHRADPSLKRTGGKPTRAPSPQFCDACFAALPPSNRKPLKLCLHPTGLPT